MYDGLVENLGTANVVSYLPEIFMKSFDDKADVYNSTELVHETDSFDVIVFTPRSFYDKNFKTILNKKTSVIKIFLDLEDDFFLRNIFKHDEITFYFKRELITNINSFYWSYWYLRLFYGAVILPPIHRKVGLPVDKINFLPYKTAKIDEKEKKLKSLPLTIRWSNNAESQIKQEKDFDLFYCMKLGTVHERNVYFHKLKKYAASLNGIKTYIMPGEVPKGEYLSALSRSKASISIRGMGFDTDRYWEIPAFGSMLFSMKLPLKI